ncbi:MAG: FtsW/RodA/SpoVE family cell cycle protein [Oscillospiraceae bacterium]
MQTVLQNISSFFAGWAASETLAAFLGYLVYFSRFMLPIAAIAVLTRCAWSMLRERYEPEVWGYLDLPDGSRVPLRSWECTVGSADSCDVVVQSPTVEPTQMVLVRDEFGNWAAYDIGMSHKPICVNGAIITETGARIEDGDSITLGKCELTFFNLTEQERAIIAERRTAPGTIVSPGTMFRYTSIFLLLVMFQQVYYAETQFKGPVALAFTALFLIMWAYYLVMKALDRRGLEVEALAFFLSTIGLSVAASATPDALLKQILLLIAGIILFLILGWWLRDLDRVKNLRVPAAVLAVLLLGANIVLAKVTNGAKNWISIGGFSFQPSEFVKIIYIYAGAATMDDLYRRKNLFWFMAFSAVCVGALALMGDFGTALVFFATFLVIAFLRSGNIATVLLSVTGAGLAGLLALTAKPYIAKRFKTWRHAWEDPNDAGMQQTRAMSALASGGLFGVGAGNGWLHTVFAGSADLVFAMVGEELGYIVALCAVAAVIVLAAFTVHNATQGRSSFYLIAGCAAVSMMMVQIILNVFGSLDILPFTGVTFPFVSTGGSSLISCWALLAYIKATDTRKSASFATKDPLQMRDYNEFNDRGKRIIDDRDLFDRRHERKGRGI